MLFLTEKHQYVILQILIKKRFMYYKNGNSKNYENILKEIYFNISITLIAQIYF